MSVAKNWALYRALPSTLSPRDIRTLYGGASPARERDSYRWNGWEFDLPPGVFRPGLSSRLIHERLLDGTLRLDAQRYAAMGVGLGVEAVVAGVRGARAVYALDIHEESVRTTAQQYSRIVGDGGPPFVGVISDLWQALPHDIQFEVVTFNPPFIDVRLSSDPYIIRNRCMGRELAARFFEELASRRLLAPGGTAYLTLSNVEPLRSIVALALHTGFEVEALHTEESLDEAEIPVSTFLLAFS